MKIKDLQENEIIKGKRVRTLDGTKRYFVSQNNKGVFLSPSSNLRKPEFYAVENPSEIFEWNILPKSDEDEKDEFYTIKCYGTKL